MSKWGMTFRSDDDWGEFTAAPKLKLRCSAFLREESFLEVTEQNI